MYLGSLLLNRSLCIYTNVLIIIHMHTCTLYTSLLDPFSLSLSELNLVDVLYQMLRDRDPQVVSNCISALSEILSAEGGMVVNTKITHYLLNRSAYVHVCLWFVLRVSVYSMPRLK